MPRFLQALLAVLVFGVANVQAEFVEGTHYQRIGTPVSAPEDRVEVIEAFAYPCPACRNFLPFISRWEHRQPEFVSFSRLPVPLQQGWELFARAYYTAEVMGLGEEAHEAVFRALHDERRSLRSFNDIAEIYTPFGVSTESFVNTSQSFAVDARMRRNRTDLTRYGVRSTPTVIVQGKWRVVPGEFRSYDELLAVVDYLVEREAEALGLSGDADAVGSSDVAADEDAAVE